MTAHPWTRPLALLTTAVLALGSIAASAPAAHAASGGVTCIGTETGTYDPGLLLTPQSAHTLVDGILALCTSSEADLTSGTYTEDFTTTLSCATLLAGRAGTRVFHWSDGQSSTFSFNRALNDVGGTTTVTFTGTIVRGELAGATVVEQAVFVTPNPLQCLAAPGLTTLGPGLVVLTISGA